MHTYAIIRRGGGALSTLSDMETFKNNKQNMLSEKRNLVYLFWKEIGIALANQNQLISNAGRAEMRCNTQRIRTMPMILFWTLRVLFILEN